MLEKLSVGQDRARVGAAAPPRASDFDGFENFGTENGASQGRNPALTGLFDTSSLSIAARTRWTCMLAGMNAKTLPSLFRARWHPISAPAKAVAPGQQRYPCTLTPET